MYIYIYIYIYIYMYIYIYIYIYILNLMMSFSSFPRRNCFRKVGFERRKRSVLAV